MDTAASGAFETATRRVLAAQLVQIVGPGELREQLREFTAGHLADEQVPAIAANLDRIAGMLIPAG